MPQITIENPIIHINDDQYEETLIEAIEIIQDIATAKNIYGAIWCLDQNYPYKHFDHRISGHAIYIWQKVFVQTENNKYLTAIFKNL